MNFIKLNSFFLDELVLYGSVRIFDSLYCDKAWSQEPLVKQLERTIGLLSGNFKRYWGY